MILIDSFSTIEATKRQLWKLITSKLDSWKEFHSEDPSVISDQAITILDELSSGIDRIREGIRIQ